MIQNALVRLSAHERAVNFVRTVRRSAFTVLGGVLTLLLCAFGPPTLVDRDAAPSQRLSVGQLRQIAQARTPPAHVSAPVVLAYELDADLVLMQRAADRPVPPASLAKLMTALLVLEQDRLQDRVTVISEDLVGGAVMGLQAGESLTVEQLLWGLLIPSGNDAAMALARQHSGQVATFVQRMNLRARELGLRATQFANPTGFDADGQVSSANDLFVLVRLLWRYPLFRQIVGTAETTVAGHYLRSTNRLLGSYPGANGVKTGTTVRAGQSLIAGIDQAGHERFAAVLGSQDRYADIRQVLAALDRTYRWKEAQPPDRPTALDRLFDAHGRRWILRAEGEPAPLFLAAWDWANLRAFRRVRPPPFPEWTSGMDAGVLEWRLGDVVVATQRLVLR